MESISITGEAPMLNDLAREIAERLKDMAVLDPEVAIQHVVNLIRTTPGFAEALEDSARWDAIEQELDDRAWRERSWLCRGSVIPEVVSAPVGEKWPEGVTQPTARAAIDATRKKQRLEAEEWIGPGTPTFADLVADVQRLTAERDNWLRFAREAGATFAEAGIPGTDLLEMTKAAASAYNSIHELEAALKEHKHTDECLQYAARTGHSFCIASCADSLQAARKEQRDDE